MNGGAVWGSLGGLEHPDPQEHAQGHGPILASHPASKRSKNDRISMLQRFVLGHTDRQTDSQSDLPNGHADERKWNV